MNLVVYIFFGITTFVPDDRSVFSLHANIQNIHVYVYNFGFNFDERRRLSVILAHSISLPCSLIEKLGLYIANPAKEVFCQSWIALTAAFLLYILDRINSNTMSSFLIPA